MDWREMNTAPMDGTPINVRKVVTYRFQPYKVGSEQRRKGIMGRWQVAGEYGGWENCAPPVGAWAPVTSPEAAQ